MVLKEEYIGSSSVIGGGQGDQGINSPLIVIKNFIEIPNQLM